MLNPNIESVFIQFHQTHLGNTLIGVIYKPPAGDLKAFNMEVFNIFNIINSFKFSTISIAGDFNIDLIKYGTNEHCNLFLDNMLSHCLIPTINKPTRITTNTSTLIDNIFVKSAKHDITSAVIYNDISRSLSYYCKT